METIMNWKGLLLGQVLAGLETGAAICASLLVNYGIEAPLFQLLWFYALTFALFAWIFVRDVRQGKVRFSFRNSLKVAVGSLFDTQANFLITYSFAFTSVTSASVLMQFSFLSAAGLSYCFAGKRFIKSEYAGTALCATGMALIVLSDMKEHDWQWTGSALGDVMVLAGAVLFSIASVYEEFLIQTRVTESEYLAYIGGYGLFIITIEAFALETAQIVQIHTYEQILSVLGFALANGGLYALMPFYVSKYGATMFNLSLITSIIYTFIFALFAYGEQAGWMYITGYAVVLVGLGMYNIYSSEQNKTVGSTPLIVPSRTESLQESRTTIQ